MEYVTVARRSSRLFESKVQPATKKPWITHVGSTKDGLEVIQKQLVSQILNIKLHIHRHAFVSRRSAPTDKSSRVLGLTRPR